MVKRNEMPVWVKLFAAGFVALLVLFGVLHLTGSTLGGSLHGAARHGGH